MPPWYSVTPHVEGTGAAPKGTLRHWSPTNAACGGLRPLDPTPRALPIYRLSLATMSRRTGRSAVAAAAYRSGTRLTDARTQRTADYRQRDGIAHTALVGWTGTRAALWNAAEAAERRADATVARELQLALPAEVPAATRRALALAFAQWVHRRYGCAVDVAVHHPGRRGDSRNHHAHLMLTTRAVTPHGEFTTKTRVLDDRRTGPREVEAMRRAWAAGVNAALDTHGIAARVDHRSHARQGRDREGAHVPRAALALEQRGVPTEAGDQVHAVRRRNRTRTAAAAVARAVPIPAPLALPDAHRVTPHAEPPTAARLLAVIDAALSADAHHAPPPTPSTNRRSRSPGS